MGHVVGTLDEVKKMVASQETFWLSDCECRENNACKKTVRVCLGFAENVTSSKNHLGKITRKEVEKLLMLAKTEKLVPRLFLDENGKPQAVCFCCSCCCCYIKNKPGSVNIAGPSIERTDMSLCISCGSCVEVCYFGARKITGGVLKVDAVKCFGCGLCVNSCAAGAISMKPR